MGIKNLNNLIDEFTNIDPHNQTELSNFKNKTFLDVGCGIGRWAEDLSKITKKYVGIDYVREFINIAKAKYNNQNKPIDNICHRFI